MVERVRHQLGAAVRFVDIFTAKPVDVPLEVHADTLPIVVGMPRLPWRAVRGLNDDTYRLMVSNNTAMPVGPIAVSVIAPGGQYLDFEPLVVTLPRPLVAHPPTPARSDFLIEHRLWPTRGLPLPPAETTIVGRLVSGGASPIARVKVKIWPDGTPAPALPYTYSNDRGEFVYRLPNLKTVNGGVITTTASLRIELRTPPLFPVVAPALVARGDGTALGVPFALDLGRSTQLVVSLP